MDDPAETGHEFWSGVLAAGGATTIPRWSHGGGPGVADHETVLPDALAAALGERAAERAVAPSAVLLAAHARVLAALSGEADVVTGYVAGRDRAPLPCRLRSEAGTWRDLLSRTGRVESQVRAHRDVPVEDLHREPGRSAPSFETVVDPDGAGGGLGGEVVLSVGLRTEAGRTVLRLRHRTDALDAGAAERIAGYHLTALTRLAEEPDADPDRATLLGADEIAHQVDALAGPARDLPDLRMHELFARRVAAHPGAVAAVCGDRTWTYRELDARANRVARALLARGLGAEDVVAVVTERNLDWLASVLAVFKAGGAYLPIEPHFPSERVATTLRRAGCRLVLTEPASTCTLEPALESLDGVRSLFVNDAYAEGHPDTTPDVAVTAGQLAYIYFTSGSTGEPKGAMCEHAGMLNHLLAKIEDLGVDEGTVLAQTAPQCFDISLWQLVAALLVGGRTLIVPQDVVLDVDRFVDTLADERVTVAQLVPSYLEAVLSALEQRPRELPDLRCVSATGEALKKELTQRWFAARPGVALVNAYGLTETSDDTNHEVMHRVPDRERVPLGPAVRNVRVYVVDPQLRPVPLGAPGEIVFSGVCVGRGYVNDPERTRAAFVADPLRAGERLYRSGDHGRWLPEGTLEFLGRKDSQVKIRGFRIEVGEIDNALLRVPGVRDGAVVVPERADGTQHLVAFYTGPAPIAAEALAARIGASLPEYMVPPVFHHRDRLPLTGNSKIDKKALTALAGELDAAGTRYRAPVTPTELRLAGLWARVLGVEAGQIGRDDDFFDRGGTSLSAVKLVIALDRMVSIRDVTTHPALADLAGLLDARTGADATRPPTALLTSS